MVQEPPLIARIPNTLRHKRQGCSFQAAFAWNLIYLKRHWFSNCLARGLSRERNAAAHLGARRWHYRMIWEKYHRWSKETKVLSLVGERWFHSTLIVWKQRLNQAAFEITGSVQGIARLEHTKKPSKTSEKALDSAGMERGRGRGTHVQVARASFKYKAEDRSESMRQLPFNL